MKVKCTYMIVALVPSNIGDLYLKDTIMLIKYTPSYQPKEHKKLNYYLMLS